MSKYYDGTKLLSMRDRDNAAPEIYILTGNNSAGKTYYFNSFLVRKFIKTGEKFGLLFRHQYELDNIADKFFGEIGPEVFPDSKMTMKKKARGAYVELYLNDKPCGYGLALSSVDFVKTNSHLFNDIERILFDEFMPASGLYLSNEVEKFRIMHVAIARGGGKQSRYVPVYMVSNTLSRVNPYYTALGISDRLQDNMKFLKGSGWVLEQGYNEAAAAAQQNSAFNKAFAQGGDTFSKFVTSRAVYVNDNMDMIETKTGRSFYLCTILGKDGKKFGARIFGDDTLYISKTADETFKITVSSKDYMNTDVLYIGYVNYVHQTFLNYMNRGRVLFQDLQCKEAFMTMM